VHPVNPDKIITPHIQIPNSHSFFLNIVQSHPDLFIGFILCTIILNKLYFFSFILSLHHDDNVSPHLHILFNWLNPFNLVIRVNKVAKNEYINMPSLFIVKPFKYIIDYIGLNQSASRRQNSPNYPCLL
jgi:hypothetical protein